VRNVILNEAQQSEESLACPQKMRDSSLRCS
jgi:hypothetical protein